MRQYLALLEHVLEHGVHPAPRLRLSPHRGSLCEFTFDDIEIADYRHHSAILAPIAV